MSGTSRIKKLLGAVALVVPTAAMTVAAAAGPAGAQAAPTGCPPGFSQARPPLNPALGCLPDNITIPPLGPLGPPTGACPPGFFRPPPPLNFQLGCLPNSLSPAFPTSPIPQ